MSFTETLRGIVLFITDSGYHPLLIALCFGIWGLAARYGRDRVTAGVFAFSILYAPLWLLLFVHVVITVVIGTTETMWLQKYALVFAELIVAVVLFIGCAVISTVALRRGHPLTRPTITALALVVAHASQIGFVSQLTAWSLN